MFQVEPPTDSFEVGDVAIPLPDPRISEESPTLTEVREVISKLKHGKAVGFCGIPADLLKSGSDAMARGLHTVLAAIWQSGTVPFPLPC